MSINDVDGREQESNSTESCFNESSIELLCIKIIKKKISMTLGPKNKIKKGDKSQMWALKKRED